MNKPTSIKELCEFIWYLEDKYDLLDFDTEGVKVWQYKRMDLYYKLAESSGVLSQPHTRLTKIEKFKYFFSYLKNTIIHNYFTLRSADIIVFSHPRVIYVDNEYIDIYTKYLIDELKEKNKILEFETAYLGIHKKKSREYSYYVDWLRLVQYIKKKFVKVEILREQADLLNRVETEINAICDVNINLSLYFKNAIKEYKVMYLLYFKIFKKVNPSICYTVNAYGQAPMIKASKDQGIKIIELQHGTFSKYHLGYSFPNRSMPLDYFPDNLYVWNNFWKNIIALPLDEKAVIVDKFRYLEQEKIKFIHLEKRKYQIVILSQGAIGKLIAQKILDSYDRFKKYSIKYKLHPGEFDRWESYPALKKLSQYDNVDIIKNEIPLYELLATSMFQVGVFSTALYEGVEFGCKTILLNISGIEYMDKFVQYYDVEVI